MSETLVADVADVLAKTGLPPQGLTLEITESVAIADTGRVRTVLRQSRGLRSIVPSSRGLGHRK